MKKQLQIPLVIILLLLSFMACQKQETYPIVPEIKFESFDLLYNTTTGQTDRGVLKISFKDGDGDIGLTQGETEPPYDYNLFISYYEMQNGDTNLVVFTDPNTGDTMTLNARIPVLTPEGNNKSIKGTIEDTMFVNNPNSQFDTIMYRVYLVDRALHKSNEIATPLIIRN